MKFLILALVVAVAYAGELESDASISSSTFEHNPDGSYQESFQTSNGINVQNSGSLKTVGDQVVLVEQGSVGYTDPEGVVRSLVYTADENGFHPEAEYLPTPPAPVAIPEYIARAIEWTAAHPYVEKEKA